MIKEKQCPYCKKVITYKKGRQYSSHIGNCTCSPNYRIKLEKIGKSHTKQRKRYKLNCPKCGKEFYLELIEEQYNKGNYRKHCSIICANSRIQTEVNNRNRSEKLKGRKISKREKRRCIVCETEFEVLSSNNRKTCSKNCTSKYIGFLKKGKPLKRYNTSGKRYKKFRYSGIWMDSSWERKFAERCDKLNIRWCRGKNIQLLYIKNSYIHRYFPDFYLPDADAYIEIKGYWTKNDQEKMVKVKEFNKNKKIIYLNTLHEIERFEMNEIMGCSFNRRIPRLQRGEGGA